MEGQRDITATSGTIEADSDGENGSVFTPEISGSAPICSIFCFHPVNSAIRSADLHYSASKPFGAFGAFGVACASLSPFPNIYR